MTNSCDVLARMRETIAAHELAGANTAALLMVSGGSDSTALAYLAAEQRDAGELKEVAMLHVNHQLRGADADADAAFVEQLAATLGIPLFMCAIDIAGEAERTHENVEAVARRERYIAANEALSSMCEHTATRRADGRIFVAHTADDRVENFYMRSIVGTGPGGFRSMRYRNGDVMRPLLDVSREDLRAYIEERAAAGKPVVRDREGALWREDATNAHTDRFRAYVRANMVPPAKEWNPALLEVLTRSMNLIAEEDDMLDAMADELVAADVTWLDGSSPCHFDRSDRSIQPPCHFERSEQAPCHFERSERSERSREISTPSDGFLLQPAFGIQPRPLQRRAVRSLLKAMLGADERIDAASVEAVLDGFSPAGSINSGYVANIQGDLAVSANKQGVRVEPMAAFRARRKRG